MKMIGRIFGILCFFFLLIGIFSSYLWPGIPLIYITLGIGGFFGFLTFLVDFKFYIQFLSMRTVKEGLNTGTLILLFLVLLFSLNYLSIRYNKKWDISEGKVATLSSLTKEVIKKTKDPLEIKVFYIGNRKESRLRAIGAVLQMYQEETSRLKVRYIDAYQEPVLTEEYKKKYQVHGKDKYMMFLESLSRGVFAIEPPFSEEQITKVFIQMNRERNLKIYFTTGHGEKSLSATDQDSKGLSLLKKTLRDFSFITESLNLVEIGKVPIDGDLLVIAGPQTDFLKREIQGIQEYLKDGGKLFVALEPGQRQNLTSFLQDWGLHFQDNYIIDQKSGFQDGVVAGLKYDTSHEITRGFEEGDKVTVFPTTSALQKKEIKGFVITELIQSSPYSVTIKKLKSQVLKAKPYRRTFFMESRSVNESGSIVLSGDSDFFTNAYLYTFFNKNLFINTVGYLTGESDIVSIPPKEPKKTNLILTRPLKLSLLGLGFLIPLLFFTVSIILWLRRN